MTFTDFLKNLFRPLPAPERKPSPPQPPRAPSPVLLRSRKQITKAHFETIVASRAALLAQGQPVSAFHYTLARNLVTKDLAGQGISVVNGGFQSRGISEAEREAGGADKL